MQSCQVINTKNLKDLSELETEGLIQRFEYTFELAWNVMKDYFSYQGNSDITGARDAIREAYQNNLIVDGELWMDMIIRRNKTSHTYNLQTAEDIAEAVYESYGALFMAFKDKMTEIQSGQTSFFE